MTETQIKTSQLANEYRSKCRKEKTSFSCNDFIKATAFGGLSPSYLKKILRALVERNFVTREGHTSNIKYSWNPLYKNADKLEEYGAINSNSWEVIFSKAGQYNKTPVKQRVKEAAVESVLTVAKAIEFLKQNCPDIKIIQKIKCYDGSEIVKEY